MYLLRALYDLIAISATLARDAAGYGTRFARSAMPASNLSTASFALPSIQSVFYHGSGCLAMRPHHCTDLLLL